LVVSPFRNVDNSRLIVSDDTLLRAVLEFTGFIGVGTRAIEELGNPIKNRTRT